MQKNVKIITGVLASALIIGGLVGCSAFDKVETTVTETATTIGKLSINEGEFVGEYEGEIVRGKANGRGKITFTNGDYWVGGFTDNKWHGIGTITYLREGQPPNSKEFDVDKMNTWVDPRNADGLFPDPKGTNLPFDINGDTEPVHPDNPNWYVVWTKRPTGIYIHKITFHEGFRAPGMKAVDIHIMARSHNKENELIQGRDEIISITGSTGKVYSMIGTKRTGVNTNAYYESFQEQEITQYQDVSVNEKSITSIVVRRDGKEITEIKPDANTQYNTTYPPKATTQATTFTFADTLHNLT